MVTTVVATEEATEGPMEGRLATGVVAATAGGVAGAPRGPAEQGVVQTEAQRGLQELCFVCREGNKILIHPSLIRLFIW